MSRAAIDLPAAHRRIVLGILNTHLPPGAQIWVFGSRATGRARRYSDLDLAIDCGRPLSLDESAALREAFADSDLPCKVDFVDWHYLDAGFRALIRAERLALTEAEG